MYRTRIKICGMSDVSLVEHAVSHGVDAIGLIFYGKSPRYVSVEQARAIRDVVPPFVTLVGVFVNESVETVQQTSQEVGLDLIQLHGDETKDYAKKLDLPYIKAIRAKDTDTITQEVEVHKQARGFLLDTYHKDKYGGTGEGFDLSIIPEGIDKPLIIAGGITPENIDIFTQKQPFALDVNSGVESEPGVKDKLKIDQLFNAIS